MTVSFQNASYLGGGVSANVFTSRGGTSVSSFFNEDYLNQKNSYKQKQEAYSIQQSGLDAAIDQKINKVLSALRNGHADKAMEAYEELTETMAAQDRYSVIAEDKIQLKAIARQLIESNMKEDEGDLESLIRNKCDNNYERGTQLINPDGDKYYEKDLLLEMCDIDESNGVWDDVAEVGGHVVGCVKGAAVGAAAGAAIGSVIPVVGTAVGAVVGGIAGFIAGIF